MLKNFQVRKSNKQKTEFITFLKQHLTKHEYNEQDIVIEEKGKRLLKTRNIIVGNPDKADIILTAHYDTPALCPFPNFMIPTNIFGYACIQIFLIFFIFFVASVITIPFALWTESSTLYAYVFNLSLLAICTQMMFGYRNPNNANDNTSGVLSLIKILEEIPRSKREKVCVVFFDNEEKGLIGSSFFAEKHKEAQGKLLLNMDCVGDGDHIVMLYKKKAKCEQLDRISEIFKANAPSYDITLIYDKVKPLMFASDQTHFDKGVAIGAIKKSKIGILYTGRIHTPFDTICDMKNIEFLTKSIAQYVEESL
jgi:hypothetical protein